MTVLIKNAEIFNDMKQRLKSEITKLFILLVAGFFYYIIFKYVGFALPCVFNKATGLLCPACGISRMFVAVANGDLYSAYGYNKLLFFTLPFLASDFVIEEIRFIKNGKRDFLRISKFFIYSEIIALIIFGTVRNIL